MLLFHKGLAEKIAKSVFADIFPMNADFLPPRRAFMARTLAGAPPGFLGKQFDAPVHWFRSG